MVTIRIVVPELNEMRQRFGHAPEVVREEQYRAMQVATLVAEGEVARRTPVKTGRARNSITSRVEQRGDTVYGTVENLPLKYIRPLEFGSRPHTITPTHAKALRFSMGGRIVFAKSVHHPGTRGAHMFRDGMRAAEPQIRTIFGEAMQRVAARVARR